MGQDSSSGTSHLAQPDHSRKCYYEILGVDLNASIEQIKKAYRKKALELHPDRNREDVENKTRLFAELQSAFQVLSDPQDRAWYDCHKDSILGGNVEASDRTSWRHRDDISARDVSIFYENLTECLRGPRSSTEFYTKVRDFFARLADEENEVLNMDGGKYPDYPCFGSETSTHDLGLKDFYTCWSNFRTAKTFTWADIFRSYDAPDRRIRRMMDKENQRKRDESARDFNYAVRSLTSYVKKKDPRYAHDPVSNVQRITQLRNLSSAQASKSRLENRAKFSDAELPEWARNDNAEGSETNESAGETLQHIECVACKKVFRSENQYASHERSKKHSRTMRLFERKVHAENVALGLDISTEESKPSSSSSVGSELRPINTDEPNNALDVEDT